MILPTNSQIDLGTDRARGVGFGAAGEGEPHRTFGARPRVRIKEKFAEITFYVPLREGMSPNDALIHLRDAILASAAPGRGQQGGQAAGKHQPQAAARPEMQALSAGDLVINPGRHEVLYKGRAIPQLTFTEFGILHHLMSHPGWVFSREQIVAGVRGEAYPVTDRAVDVQIAGLRKKLGAAADHVQTVRGVGYRFKD